MKCISKINIFLYILGLLLLCACHTSKNQLDNSKNLWETHKDTLVFYAQSAAPMMDGMLLNNDMQQILPPGSSGNLIQLSPNTNFIRFTPDSVKSFLPYFGRVFVSSISDAQKSALELVSTKFTTKTEIQKHGITYIEWAFTDQRDLNQIQLYIGKNGRATLRCKFNLRQPINFSGEIRNK